MYRGQNASLTKNVLSESKTQTGPHKDWITRAHTCTSRQIVFLLLLAKFIDVKWTVKCPLKHSRVPIKHLLQTGSPSIQQPDRHLKTEILLLGLYVSLGFPCLCWSSFVAVWAGCQNQSQVPLPTGTRICLSVCLSVLLSLHGSKSFFYLFSFHTLCWQNKTNCLLK